MRWIRLGALALLLAGGAALAQDRSAAPSNDRSARATEELPAVARLRALLGPDIALSYAAAEPLAPDGARLRGAVLRAGEDRAEFAELALQGMRENGIDGASGRDVTARFAGTTLRLAGLELRGLAAPAGGLADLALESLQIEALALEGDTRLTLAEAVLEQLGQGRPARLEATGLELQQRMEGKPARLGLRRLVLAGIDTRALLAAASGANLPFGANPHAVLAELEDAALSLDGAALGSLGLLRIAGEPSLGGVDAGRLTLRGLRIEPSPLAADWLRRFDLPALVLDAGAALRLDMPGQRLDLEGLEVAARELGTFGLSLALAGVTEAAVEQADWDALRLAGLSLRYRDLSLLPRAARDAARQRRMPEARVREDWAAQAEKALAGGRGQAPGPVATAVRTLLRGEAKELEITARPPEPVELGALPAAALMGLPRLQQVLGLTAEAR